MESWRHKRSQVPSPDYNPPPTTDCQSEPILEVDMHIQYLLLLFLVACVLGGPVGYGVCQAGCASVAMACYSAAGFTWGATAGITAPASIIACNSAFGTCQAACVAAGLLPTP